MDYKYKHFINDVIIHENTGKNYGEKLLFQKAKTSEENVLANLRSKVDATEKRGDCGVVVVSEAEVVSSTS